RPLAVGVDLGGTTIKTGLVTTTGDILYQNSFDTQAQDGPGAVIRQIGLSVHDALEHAAGGSVTGIGIGSPGQVDDRGVVKAPPNFKDFHAVPLSSEIESMFSIPTKVENDANAAAIAEGRFGAGKPFADFLFVIWGTGVGGGIIMNHRIFRGPTGGAGEIGHISIDHRGAQCNCGSVGCVEAYVGQRYLSERTAEKLKTNPGSKILDLVGGDLNRIEPLYISRAAEAGDPLAREILEEAGAMLGVAIGAVMNTLDFRISIIGGGVSSVGVFVFDAITESVRSHVMKPMRPDIRVLRAQLGNTAGILGAAGLVL
ncbi:MAG: ROK family protein, partial [Bacteroidota bacterium]